MADASTAAVTNRPPAHDGGAGPLRVGQSFGPRYHVLKVLGVGGMGAVYQAWDAELSEAVALKVIRADRRQHDGANDAERRFKQELLLARQVTHKNVVRIHDINEIDGIKYITMPFIQGHDLATVLRRDAKLAPARALGIARQIADGLQAAHEAGVVHRDLKPANIMIGIDGVAVIMDFGISATAGDGEADGVVGTLEYMAPEQTRGSIADQRSDIYAFGLIVYEMLTGLRQSRAASAQERIEAMRERTTKGLPPPRSLDPQIPAHLDAVVTRCLALEPAARFQSAMELRRALDQLDDKGAAVVAPSSIRWRRIAAVVGGLALLGGAAAGAVYFSSGRTTAPAAPHDPVSVVIADFQNSTGDAAFDHALEPMLKIALESAGFINAYDRNGIARSLGVKPPETLDERGAQELAAKQGLGVVLSGAVERDGASYDVSVRATKAVAGTVIANAKANASTKEQVLGVATTLAGTIRKALGDNTPDRFAMETLSATSLEVVRDYAAGAQAMSNSRFEEALEHFASAAKRDPNFGFAYAGMAIASKNLDRQQDAERYIKQAVSHLDGMTERERYRTRGVFYMITGDHQQCVKEFGDLIARYAADASARNNLALCLTGLRNLPRAVDEMRQVVTILPKRALYRVNLALYADYNGDPQTAEAAVRATDGPGVFGQLALAYAQLLRGQTNDAQTTYGAIGKIDALGASYMASGLGDLAVYEGRFEDAAKIFAQGAAADVAAKDSDRAADKFAALAYARLQQRRFPEAIAAARQALEQSKAMKIQFLAARVFTEAGAPQEARPLVATLESSLHAEPRAYAAIVQGEAALKNNDFRQATKLFSDANTLQDTWIGHFDLGRAFLAAGAFTAADSEFDRCIKRRGEALAMFLDEEPTFGRYPVVFYYQGRVREAIGTAGFRDSYRAYLAMRGKSTEDPLAAEVRTKAGN